MNSRGGNFTSSDDLLSATAAPPAWVLLNRNVRTINKEEIQEIEAQIAQGQSEGAAAAAAAVVHALKVRGAVAGAIKVAPNANYRDLLGGIEPYPDHVVDPPGVSSFLLRLSAPALNLLGAFITSSYKNFLALYAGFYRPAVPSYGFYMVYDARAHSLAAIPQVPFDRSYPSIGSGVAVLSHGEEGDYVLIELLTKRRSTFSDALPDSKLSMWFSSGMPASGWIQKKVWLPSELCTPSYDFRADTVFSFGHSCVCWVDLVFGILMCDDVLAQKDGDMKFRFVKLPEECSVYNFYGRGLIQGYRSMNCVSGAVKFVSLEGYRDGCLKSELILTIWTLIPDLWEWKKDAAVRVGDLWTFEGYIGLPQLEPTCPIYDIHEDNILYVLLSDFKFLGEQFDSRGELVSIELENLTHYVLRLDVRCKKILSSTKCPPGTVPNLFASEFSTYVNKTTARDVPNEGDDETGTSVNKKQDDERETSHSMGSISSLRFTMFDNL